MFCVYYLSSTIKTNILCISVSILFGNIRLSQTAICTKEQITMFIVWYVHDMCCDAAFIIKFVNKTSKHLS